MFWFVVSLKFKFVLVVGHQQSPPGLFSLFCLLLTLLSHRLTMLLGQRKFHERCYGLKYQGWATLIESKGLVGSITTRAQSSLDSWLREEVLNGSMMGGGNLDIMGLDFLDCEEAWGFIGVLDFEGVWEVEALVSLHLMGERALLTFFLVRLLNDPGGKFSLEFLALGILAFFKPKASFSPSLFHFSRTSASSHSSFSLSTFLSSF